MTQSVLFFAPLETLASDGIMQLAGVCRCVCNAELESHRLWRPSLLLSCGVDPADRRRLSAKDGVLFFALTGTLLFQRFLKVVPFRSIFAWSTVLSSLGGMTTLLLVTHANRSLGIDDQWFSLGDSAILTVMGQIAFMTVLVMSARLCPAGIEAALFALRKRTFG